MTKTATIEQYFQAWNTKDQELCKELLANSFHESGAYIDPHIPEPVTNRQGMFQIIQTFRSRLPHLLQLVGAIEFAPHAFRLHWEMVHEGQQLSKGIFVGTFAADGTIKQVIGFID